MKIMGYYNKDGYTIETLDGETLYSAGNNHLESSSVIDNGLPLETIKAFCEQTGKEIAVEMGADFVGAEEMDD